PELHDQRPVRPGTGAGGDEPVTAGLHGVAIPPIGGDAGVDVVGVPDDRTPRRYVGRLVGRLLRRCVLAHGIHPRARASVVPARARAPHAESDLPSHVPPYPDPGVAMTLPLVPVPTRLQWQQGGPVHLDHSAKVWAPRHLAPAVAGMLGIAEEHVMTDDGAWASGQDQPGCAVVLSETPGDGEGYVLRAGDGVVALTGSRMGLLRGLATVVQLRDLAAPG